LRRLEEAGLRAGLDSRPEKIGAKIRDAQLEKIPVMLVVGAKEAEQGTVSFRDRVDGDKGAMPLADAVAQLKQQNDTRAMHHAVAAQLPAANEDHEERHTY
jgi:threonyl-tRNA synthetase